MRLKQIEQAALAFFDVDNAAFDDYVVDARRKCEAAAIADLTQRMTTLVVQAYEEAALKLLARHEGAPEGHDVYADAEAVRALKDQLVPPVDVEAARQMRADITEMHVQIEESVGLKRR